jgi:hypothetical protein
MRCLVRVLLPAVLVALAGCSLFENHDAQVARITYITAPDTVLTDSTFQATVTAMLGPDSGYVLDHCEVTAQSDAKLTVRVWSRDTASVRPHGDPVAMFKLTIDVTPTEAGEFRVLGYEPDGSALEKTITVLP